MRKPIRYSVQEDVLLAESMLEVRRKYTRRCPETLRFRFPQVYKLFSRKRSRFGIAGAMRTKKSVQSRIYSIREAHRQGRFHRVRAGDEAMCLKWDDLWTEVLGNEDSPAKHQTGRLRGANCSRFQAGAYEQGEELPNGVDGPPQPQRHQSNEQRQENATRLLDAFRKACKGRAEIEITREKTRSGQQRLIQDQRKWKKRMLRTIIENSSSGHEDSFSEFMQTLEDITKSDAELDRLREEGAAERIENDMENWEWERDTFEDLLAQYVDKQDKC